MSFKRRKTIFIPALIVSLLIHTALLFKSTKELDFSLSSVSPNHKFKLKSIRTVGEKKGKKEKLLYIPQPKNKVSRRSKGPSLQDLKLSPYTPKIDAVSKEEYEKSQRKHVVRSLDINKNQIKDFLRNPAPGFLTPRQALQALGDTDVDIKLEVPKGIAEDELNKHELVFYSFQRRTVMAYINSFKKELHSFERRNPHLQFPLTKHHQLMAGRVVYDKNGDIMRIETLKWSHINKLQGFFMDVLKNMTALPNPPKEILENDQFAINFILNVNPQ